MGDSPLVSVVVPTYDRPDVLERAIRSVSEQSYRPLELIVVDGPSDVPATTVLQSMSLDFEYRCLRNEELAGLPAARNSGIKVSNGDYLAFLDDDDQWRTSKIEKQVRRIERASDQVGAVYTGVRQFDSSGRTTAVRKPTTEGDVLLPLLDGNFIGTPSCLMVSTNLSESINHFDAEMKSWEDWDYYLRLARDYRFAAVEGVLVDRAIHDDQMTRDIRTLEKSAAPRLVEKHAPTARHYNRERRFVASVEFAITETAYNSGQYGPARRHAFNAVRKYPRKPRWVMYLLLLLGGRYTFAPVQCLKRRLRHYLSAAID